MAGVRKLKNAIHYRMMVASSWPLIQCTCIPRSLCTQQSELGMQVHCIGGQREGRHGSAVGRVLGFFCWRLFVLFTGPSLLEMKFLQNPFPLVK